MSSRLFQEIREKRGLVYSIYSFTAPYMDGGLFGIYAGTGESEAAELMPVTLEELRKVQRDVTEAELARARAQVKAALLMSLESTGSRCEQLARQLQVFGRVVPTAETVAKINAVTHRRCAARRRAACSAPRRRWPRWARPSGCRRCPRSPTGWPPDGMKQCMDIDLDLLADLIARARAAGPMPPMRCWSPAPRCRCSAGWAQTEHRGTLGGPRSRPARVRRPARRPSSPPPPSIPPASPRWPSARWRWRGWCRRTRIAGLADDGRAAGRRSTLDLDDPGRAGRRGADRARRARPRRRRWRCPASPTPRAPRPASAAPRWCWSPPPGSPAATCAPAIRSRPPRWPAAAPAMQRDYDYHSTVHLADLDDAGGDRPQRRRAGGGAAEPDAAEDREAAGGLRPARRRQRCSAISPARSTARRSRAAPAS